MTTKSELTRNVKIFCRECQGGPGPAGRSAQSRSDFLLTCMSSFVTKYDETIDE
jgi:hypothetical protein